MISKVYQISHLKFPVHFSLGLSAVFKRGENDTLYVVRQVIDSHWFENV
jgi:hypothetical protein